MRAAPGPLVLVLVLLSTAACRQTVVVRDASVVPIALDAALTMDSGSSSADSSTEDAGSAGDAAAGPPDSGCGGGCRCTTDFGCESGFRCESDVCVPGLRIGDPCRDAFACPGSAHCDLDSKRCDQWCVGDTGCPDGYRCSPDGYCVEACNEFPRSAGQQCMVSPDCNRCGVCVDFGTLGLLCAKPCRLANDCTIGQCTEVDGTRVCTQ